MSALVGIVTALILMVGAVGPVAAPAAPVRDAAVIAPAPPAATVTCDDLFSAMAATGSATITRSVAITVDSTVVVRLCASPGTGFAWQATYDQAALVLVDHSTIVPFEPLPGAAVEEVWQFRARAAGQETATFVYGQAWTGGRQNAATVVVSVVAVGSVPAVTIPCDAFTQTTRGSGPARLTRYVTATVGESVRITLCSNPTTGFSWQQPRYTRSALRLVRHTATGPASTALGAPGSETWTFRSLRPGNRTIWFGYSRAWSGGEKDAWAVRVVVRVTA